jgi:FMN-dependent NADH-azoreductase
MILFIDACVRAGSRTRRLAEHLLGRLGGPVREEKLSGLRFPAADADFIEQRDALSHAGSFEHPLFDLARRFAEADEIVVAAPFWDLSFPSALKRYFEQVNALGVTFTYSPEGVPVGLCRAKKLWYVTTAGGPVFDDSFGYGYVRALARGFYGIAETQLIKAEGLDILGADVEAILRRAEREIDALCPEQRAY